MNTIILRQVSPDFLEKEKIERSGIWMQDLQFSKGDRIQVVAPSGSGKTSLIHFLYGLRKDFHGEILIDKKNMRSIHAEQLATLRSRQLSVIFQDLRLFPDHTAFDNIDIKRSLDPYHEEDRIYQMAEKLGIYKKLKQLARTCSYGEQQRIAIVRALQQPFDFLLMDEPFSHLDEKNRHLAMDLIEEEAGRRQAAIILADLKPIEYFTSDKLLNL